MTDVLGLLGWATAFGLAQLILAAAYSNLERGWRWGAGPRDEPRPLTGVAARLDRAFRNYLETFPFFAAAVLLVTLSDGAGTMALVGAHLYFWARIVYLPLYAFGVFLARSIVWNFAFLGIILILLDAAM